MTAREKTLAALGLSFPIPSDEAFRIDLSDRDIAVLLLAGISQLTQTATGEGAAQTASIDVVDSSGTVPAGARKVTFILSVDFTGTILGSNFSGMTDTAVPFEAQGNGTLNAIAYTVTAGSARVITIV